MATLLDDPAQTAGIAALTGWPGGFSRSILCLPRSTICGTHLGEFLGHPSKGKGIHVEDWLNISTPSQGADGTGGRREARRPWTLLLVSVHGHGSPT